MIPYYIEITMPLSDQYRSVAFGIDDDDGSYFVFGNRYGTKESADEINEQRKRLLPEGWKPIGVYKLAYTGTNNERKYEYRGFELTPFEVDSKIFGISVGVVDVREDTPVDHGNFTDIESALHYIDMYLFDPKFVTNTAD